MWKNRWLSARPDTLDTFVDSSWYFLRFCDPTNSTLPFSKFSANSKMPVDAYIGGIEHAVLHLLYARFMQRSLYYQGMVDTPEPFSTIDNARDGARQNLQMPRYWAVPTTR